MDRDSVLAEKLNLAWRFFYGRGYIDGFGHVSARSAAPERIVMTRHNLGRDSTAADFVLVDLDGNRIGNDAPLPGELPIHLDIYRARPDVGAIVHFHSHYSTSFGMSERDLKPSYFLASIFRSGIPVHPDSRLISDRERGAALAKTLGPHRAAILKAHGIVVVGADIEEMVAAAFIMEDNAHRTWLSAAMGEVDYLTEAEMAEVEAELLETRGPFQRIWALCEAEARESMTGGEGGQG